MTVLTEPTMDASPNRRDPRSFENRFQKFYEQYDHTVRAVIRKSVPRSLGDNVDDLAQEVWRQFIEGKNGRSYLDIFDPEKGAATTFMWEFTRLRCLQFLSRTERTPTARAFSIQAQVGEEFTIGIIDPETSSQLGFDEEHEIIYKDLLDRATSAIHRHKIRGRRDLRWVWYLLRHGYRQDQIAKEMGLSEGTISICMDLLREIPEVQELHEYAIELGLLHVSRPL